MISRLIVQELELWLAKPDRKPLVIRGARQVGKTTVVNQFAKRFEQYIYLNLELKEDQKPFVQYTDIEQLIQALFFLKNRLLSKKANTLIFIDEIQEVPQALNLLRYFYEQEPEIKVIAAGSMLESLFDKHIHFPVGRVEYKVLRPLSFPEFLDAMGENLALDELRNIPLRAYAHDRLLKLYHQYAITGGMPEVVKNYALNKDFTALNPIFDSLIASYLEDVEKYAKSDSQILHLRHVIKSSFAEAGKRIQFAGFGNSSYRSREMGECLRILEKALLIQLLYPNTSATLPFQPDLKKSPRLQILDTGMLNHFVGIQKEILESEDMSSIYKGTMIKHLTGQELLATKYNILSELYFWAKDKKSSSAEVDFVISFEGKVIPIETKSGKSGRMKSLHIYMDTAPHDLAVRFYAGQLSISEVKTPHNKKYFLLNLPYYAVSQIEAYLTWFQEQVKARLHTRIK